MTNIKIEDNKFSKGCQRMFFMSHMSFDVDPAIFHYVEKLVIALKIKGK